MNGVPPRAPENPFDAPRSLHDTGAVRTAAGFTSRECFIRFLLVGAAAGVVGGSCLFHVATNATNVVAPFGAIGLPFAAALMLSSNRFVGAMPRAKSLFIVIGTAVGFICCGIVYQATRNGYVNGVWMGPWPTTWRQILAPGFWGAASGSAFIAIVLRAAGGRFTWKTTATTWAIMTTIGFVAIALSDEIGIRRRMFPEPLTARVAGGMFVAIVLAVLGWSPAEAHGTFEATSEQE